jgi:Flp pilus assembly protein TadG
MSRGDRPGAPVEGPLKRREPLPSRRSNRCSRGSTLVEFAFLVPVLFALVFGVIDFGRALYTYHFVSNAAREATRWASVRGWNCVDMTDCNASAAQVSAYVASIVPAGIDSSSSRLSVTPTWVAPPNNLAICAIHNNYSGCAVKVQVSYQFKFVLPFLPASGINMTSTSQMVISQ